MNNNDLDCGYKVDEAGVTWVKGVDYLKLQNERDMQQERLSVARQTLACIADNPMWTDHHYRAKAALQKIRAAMRGFYKLERGDV